MVYDYSTRPISLDDHGEALVLDRRSFLKDLRNSKFFFHVCFQALFEVIKNYSSQEFLGMVGKKTVTLLSLLVLLMLVSGEEELIRVKRLHNDEPALSSKPIIQPPAGEPLQGQPDKEHPLPKTITLHDDDPLREASPDTKGDPAMQNPVKPSSSETVVGRIKKRIKRMAEDASLLKRGITHHFLGRDDDAAVIEEERLKREKRQRG